MGVFKGLLNLVGLVLYLLDMYSDGSLALFFFAVGHFIWGGMTLSFVLGPLILTNICAYYGIYRAIRNYDTQERKYNAFGHLVNYKIRLFLSCILVLPFVLMVYGIVDIFRGNENYRTLASQGMKLLEIFLESLPQMWLQSFIIFQILYGTPGGELIVVGVWQWLTLCISVINLSFSISTGYMCTRDAIGSRKIEPTTISKVVYFFLGGMTLVSRTIVCSLLALIAKPLWFLPIGCAIVFSMTVWCIKRFCRYAPCMGLRYRPHYICKPSKIGIVILMWLTTAIFNSFTASGIPIALVNLAFSIGGFFFVPEVAAIPCIIAIVLSSFNLLANLVLTLTPSLRRTIGKDWLLIDDDDDDDGESIFY